MATYLDRILAAHRATAAADGRDLSELLGAARRLQSAVRPYGPALAASSGRLGQGTGVAVIAEIKRRSPSKGDIGADLVADVLAKAYADGGAACLSVLTDREFFGGSAEDLAVARAASGLPVLRKDFTVCEADVCDARLMGADAVLLIAAALSPRGAACELPALAAELGLARPGRGARRSRAGARLGRRGHPRSGSTSGTWSPSRSTPAGPSGWWRPCRPR